MTETTYRIRYSETLTVETASAFVAELESRAGYPVFAVTGNDDV